MAISVTWATKIINVPKADMTLIQSTPTEIRELDLNAFRLSLKDLEDGAEGMPFLDTHRHNTEVDVGGLVLARVVEIINGYTVTFEDGQYAVNLVGANSNVGDVINVNQVSVRSFNSAGLISNPAIEYASFNGGVTVDQTGSTVGTVYNKGTPENPVNNFADANLIADYRGFNTFYVRGNATLDTGDSADYYIVRGENANRSIITISGGASTVGTEFQECTLTGTLDGGSIVRDSLVATLFYVDGIIFTCMLQSATITLSSVGTAHFLDCFSGVPGTGTPIIDFNGTGSSLAMRNYNGGITLTNKSGQEDVSIDMNSGQVRLDPDPITGIVSGTIVIRGVGKVVDADTDHHIPAGTSIFNGATIINETVTTAVDELHRIHGLKTGHPLEVTETSRQVKDDADNVEIDQSIFDDGTTTTVERI